MGQYREKVCPYCNVRHRKRGPYCCQSHANYAIAAKYYKSGYKLPQYGNREKENNITKELLNETFTYRDGNLYWNHDRSYKIKKGMRAGHILNTGRMMIYLNGKQYMAHRLIYIYHYDLFDGIIDHINRDHTDNRIENLRICNQSQNQANSFRKTNRAGYRGVVKWSYGRYKAKIRHKGIIYDLGVYDTAEEASKVYLDKQREIYGEFVPQ